MSFWAQAMLAANKAVTAPMMAMVVEAAGAWTRIGATRASRYTPAVTMVAAWMRAETGAGPSMASGSQTNSGICADVPQAPRISMRQIAVAVYSVIPLVEMAP